MVKIGPPGSPSVPLSSVNIYYLRDVFLRFVGQDEVVCVTTTSDLVTKYQNDKGASTKLGYFMRITMEKIANFLCQRNSCNIFHKTGVRVSMGVFTLKKISFLSIFSILTLMNHSYFVDGPFIYLMLTTC